MHYRGFKRNHVPSWLRKLTFGVVARITFMQPLYSTDGKLLTPTGNAVSAKRQQQQRNQPVDLSKIYRNHNASRYNDANPNHVDYAGRPDGAERNRDLEEFRRLIGLSGTTTAATLTPQATSSRGNFAQLSYETQSTNLSMCNMSMQSASPATTAAAALDGDIMGRIRRLLDKFDEEKKMEDNLAEWRRVGEIMDRFCFYIFLLLICWTTIALLLISPLTKHE